MNQIIQIYEVRPDILYNGITSAKSPKNNIHNDTLSAKLKATKCTKILSDSRLQAGAVPLQRRLSVAGIAGLLSSRSKLPSRTPVGLSSTLHRPLRRQTPPCQSCTSSHVLTAGCLQLLFTAFQGNLDFCPFTDKTGQCKLLPKRQLVITRGLQNSSEHA